MSNEDGCRRWQFPHEIFSGFPTEPVILPRIILVVMNIGEIMTKSHEKIENFSFTQFFHSNGLPSHYESDITLPLFWDLTLSKILILYLVSTIFLAVISLGYPTKERIFFFFRIFCCISVITTIFGCLFLPFWESDSVQALVRKSYDSPPDIVAEIGLRIGLKGLNITLREIPNLSARDYTEELHYNERIHWNWVVGGEESSTIKETGELEAQLKKLNGRAAPLPISWIAEYMTIDAEKFRFGRHYQRLGWYSYMLLWVALGTWLLAAILFCMVVEYGSSMMIVTGLLLQSVSFLWIFTSDSAPLCIPFGSPIASKTVFLCPSFSWSFYANLINGSFCLIFGIIIYLVDIRYPDLTSFFFGLDIAHNYEQFFKEIEEENRVERERLEAARKADEAAFSAEIDADSKYVALRKKVVSNRMSRLHRLTVVGEGGGFSAFNDRSRKTAFTKPKNDAQSVYQLPLSPPFSSIALNCEHYAVPKPVKIRVQPTAQHEAMEMTRMVGNCAF